jgi:PAS domain-containing protein
MEATLTFLRDKNGEAVGIIASPGIFSERKAWEEKLQFEERRFRNFVEHSADIIVLVNLEGLITYIKPGH